MSERLNKLTGTSIATCKRLTSSTFVLTFVAIFAFSAFVEIVHPIDLLFFTGLTTIRQNNMVSKLPKILNASENPEVLVLGSSLSLYPMAHLDDVLKENRTRWDSTYVRYHIVPYSRADYLENLLSKKLGKKVAVANASIVAAVISDQYLILKKYLKAGKKPELVILCIAPRDFLHDNHSKVGKSPTFEVLADFQNISDLVSNNPDPRSLIEFALGKSFSYYNARRDYKHVLASAASRISGRPIDFFAAAVVKGERTANIFEVDKFWETEAVWQQPPNTLKQMDEYKAIYVPFDSSRFEVQKSFFDRLLSLANENKIDVCVVNMPLTNENLALIPQGGLRKYDDVIRATCNAHGTLLLEPALHEKYEIGDFEDCAHLNLKGGARFFQSVVDGVTANRRIASKLAGADLMLGSADASSEDLRSSSAEDKKASNAIMR